MTGALLAGLGAVLLVVAVLVALFGVAMAVLLLFSGNWQWAAVYSFGGIFTGAVIGRISRQMRAK